MTRTMMVFLIAVLICGTAWAGDPVWPDCRVEMVDGTVHEHVDVFWKLEGFMLGLRTSDGREFNLSPVDVARIHDDSGRHITEEVADASPADTHFALLGRQRVEPEGMGLAFDAGGSLSVTSGFGGFEGAGAVFAGARRELSLSWHLRGQYRRQRVRESVPDLGAPMGAWSNEVAVLLGWRAVHPRRNSHYTYVEAGPVLVAWSRRWDGVALSTVSGGSPGVGLLMRGGVLLRLGEHVGLDLGAMASLRPSIDVHADDLGVVIGLNAAVAVY
ncbi:MAG: hypothetical protein GY838_11090 [bacterium]|nr:hypothetical protein [bacterium]